MDLPIPIALILLGGACRAISCQGSALDEDPAYPSVQVYTGMCDASAAAPLGDNLFIVANDEDNVLRIYAARDPGAAIGTIDLSAHLGTEDEADIEGATRLGDRIYWIGSHGRSKKGKRRFARQALFATDIRIDPAGGVSVHPRGKPYRGLIGDLVESDNPAIAALQLRGSTRNDSAEIAELAPKRAGFNIEALASDPEGEFLLIGLRNPRPGGKAVLIPLLNPARVIDNGEQPVFGDPIHLDLGGLGLRALEYSHEHESYLLIAGSHAAEDVSALYRWDGSQQDQPVLVSSLAELNPEAILVYAGSKTVQLLSDDGSLAVDEDGEAKECKALNDPGTMSFRSTRVAVPD